MPCPWKHIETPATSETAPLSAVPNRKQSNILGLRHVIGCDFVAPRRSSSAHLHRPWRGYHNLLTSAPPRCRRQSTDLVDPLRRAPRRIRALTRKLQLPQREMVRNARYSVPRAFRPLAITAPCAMKGSMGWAASPNRTIRPRDHRGTGPNCHP